MPPTYTVSSSARHQAAFPNLQAANVAFRWINFDHRRSFKQPASPVVSQRLRRRFHRRAQGSRWAAQPREKKVDIALSKRSVSSLHAHGGRRRIGKVLRNKCRRAQDHRHRQTTFAFSPPGRRKTPPSNIARNASRRRFTSVTAFTWAGYFRKKIFLCQQGWRVVQENVP